MKKAVPNTSRKEFIVKGPSFAQELPPELEIRQFREAITDDRALSLFDYWLSKCPGTGVPDKSTIDPLDFPKLLDGIFMEEWDAELEQSKIKLAGEFHREPDMSSIRGKTVDDLTQGTANDIWKACDRYNFFELRPTVCGYVLNQFSFNERPNADLTLPVRQDSETIMTVGYTWQTKDRTTPTLPFERSA